MRTLQQQYIDLSNKLEQLEAERDYDNPSCVALRESMETIIDLMESELIGGTNASV